MSVLALLAGFAPAAVLAQVPDSTANGPLDSLAGGTPRPHRGNYLVQTFPSPATAGESVTIQYYNHNPVQSELRIVDLLDRAVTNPELQAKMLVQNGLHVFHVPTRGLSAGMYFIRLTTFTADGTIDQVQDSRFVIVH